MGNISFGTRIVSKLNGANGIVTTKKMKMGTGK